MLLTRLLALSALLLLTAAVRADEIDETAAPPGSVATVDIAYSSPKTGPLKLDLYTPPGDGPFPTVLWFHGGAWMMGDRTGWPHMMFLLRHGYAVANVDYRLTPIAPFPAMLDDCEAALDYLTAHAKELKLDPSRCVATGESAGGHLAALLGLTRGAKLNAAAPGKIQAVIDLFGPTDLNALAASNPRFVSAFDLFTGKAKDSAALLNRASPLELVRAGDPPILILHGDKDPLVPIDQSRQFATKLQQAGVDVKLIILPGAGHASPAFWTSPLRDQMVAFLNRTVGPGK